MSKMRIPSFIPVVFCVVAVFITGCSKEEAQVPRGITSDFRDVALEFTQLLAAREFDSAYAMTSHQYRRTTTVDELRAAFESIVPADWGPIRSVSVDQSMTSWSGQQSRDIGWAYVTIAGGRYSEAVSVVVTLEQGVTRIGLVEMGRP